MRVVGSLLLGLAGLGVLTGCVGPTGLSGDSGYEPAERVFPVEHVEFEGPWAPDLQEAFDSSPPGFIRDALRDGRITDQERAETVERVRSCLADLSIAVEYHADGSSTISRAPDSPMSTDEMVAAGDRCSHWAGEWPVITLYNWMRRNPENLDVRTILRECLIDVGALDAAYSLEEFKRLYALRQLPYQASKEGIDQERLCLSDPLGLIGLKPPSVNK